MNLEKIIESNRKNKAIYKQKNIDKKSLEL